MKDKRKIEDKLGSRSKVDFIK